MSSRFGTRAYGDGPCTWPRWFRQYRCQLQKFAMDPWCAPAWISQADVSYEVANLAGLTGPGLGGLDSSRSSKGGIPCGSTKSRLLVERFGRKSANLSIGETTKPRRSCRQFASEAGDRGRSVRTPAADDARPKSRLAGQHGSVTSLAGKKTRADRGSTWKGAAYRLAANNVNAFNRNLSVAHDMSGRDST